MSFVRQWSKRFLVLVSALPQVAWAQRDMMGIDLVSFLGALPTLVLYALGELAAVLLALLLLLSLITWAAGRLLPTETSDDETRSYLFKLLRGPVPFLVMTVLAATYALFHATQDVPVRHSSSKAPALQAPNGKAWPEKTGYLDMPQSPTGGIGVIKLSHRSSGGRVYVKLCIAGEKSCAGLRHIILQKFSEFEVRGLPAGSYEIRMLRIDPPIVAGKSRAIKIVEGTAAPHILRLPMEPVMNSAEMVYAIKREEF